MVTVIQEYKLSTIRKKNMVSHNIVATEQKDQTNSGSSERISDEKQQAVILLTFFTF